MRYQIVNNVIVIKEQGKDNSHIDLKIERLTANRLVVIVNGLQNKTDGKTTILDLVELTFEAKINLVEVSGRPPNHHFLARRLPMATPMPLHLTAQKYAGFNLFYNRAYAFAETHDAAPPVIISKF